MKRGQASLEFLLIISFAFVLIVPIMILFFTQANDLNHDVTSAQVSKISTELQQTVDEVYYLGEPTTRTMDIYIPENVNSAELTDSMILFNVSSGKQSYLVVRSVSPNITGTLNTNPGMHHVKVYAQGRFVFVEG